jgi:hypothetical protein
MLFLDKQLPDNLRVCPKINNMHIRPSNLHKMGVKLPTQVFTKVFITYDGFTSNNNFDGMGYLPRLPTYIFLQYLDIQQFGRRWARTL